MKKIFVSLSLIALLTPAVWGQKYKMTFVVPKAGPKDTMMYIGQHYRDEFVILDSTRAAEGDTYVWYSGRWSKSASYADADVIAY